MRVAAAVLLVGALAVPAPQRNMRFFPVGVDYPLSATASIASIVRDLQVIRTAGFNTLKLTWSWRAGEPVRGGYATESIERTLAQAGQLGLRVMVAIDDTAPDWIFERYADAERQTAAGRTRQACFDHPGVHADAIAFVKAIAATAARHTSVLAIDVGSHRPAGMCLCPYTTRRMKSLTGAQALDDRARARIMHRDDLAELAAAAAASRFDTASRTSSPSLLSEPAAYAPDDWVMAGVVDRYGLTMHARTSMRLAADDLASATRGKGWWVDVDATVPEQDRRLASWTAIARGAQGLIYDDPPLDLGFIRSLVRNPALFTQLRPRQAQTALLFDPLAPDGRTDLLAAAHHALYGRQITSDIHNVEQLGVSDLRGYRAIVATSSRELPASAREAIASARAAGAAFVDAARTGDGIETIVRTGLSPVVRIDGGSDVEVRFLESPTVQMIVGLNHGSQSQRVTMVFSPDTQEAIWLNMETGTGVNFVAGPTGPIYQYWFRPKDALVLMIRKDIR